MPYYSDIWKNIKPKKIFDLISVLFLFIRTFVITLNKMDYILVNMNLIILNFIIWTKKLPTFDGLSIIYEYFIFGHTSSQNAHRKLI